MDKEPILQFFEFGHLRLTAPDDQEVAVDFRRLAQALIRILPRTPERTVALRKLLEAKDAVDHAQHYNEYF